MTIKAENLGKRFNREWVFRKFNYELSSGKTYVILGPNGSGKSTLMQILWGQMTASQGSVTYPMPSEEVFRSVSIAAPYMDLIDEFTLEEMIDFHFKFKKCRLPVPEIIERLELESAQKKFLSTFSSGMRQRLKLGLAFFSQTQMLFLDEPCTNLDRQAIAWYHDQLKQVPGETLICIASNQESEYPATAEKIDILCYK